MSTTPSLKEATEIYNLLSLVNQQAPAIFSFYDKKKNKEPSLPPKNMIVLMVIQTQRGLRKELT